MDRGGIADQRIKAVKHPPAIGIKQIKRAGARQHFQRPLAHAFQINAACDIEQIDELALATRLGHKLHRLDAYIFQSAQRVDHFAVFDRECRVRAVHARRDDLDIEDLGDLFFIDAQLIGQMQVAIHHASHELDGVIRLQPRGLIAHHRIGSCVRFIEAVIGEFLQQIKDFAGFLLVDPIGDGPSLELGALLGHFLGDFLTHRAAQQIGTAKRIARHDLRDLHHLFLVNDNALGLGQNMIDQRMDGFQLLEPVLHLAIGRNIFHRAGAVQRHQRHDILNACRLHAPERIHHARAFHLKHSHGFGRGIEIVAFLIVERDRPDINLDAAKFQQIQCVLDHC